MVEPGSRSSAYANAKTKAESVLFDEHDSNKEEKRISYVGNEDPEINKHGKIINKKMRAFDISVDSSKDFEIALRKPRKKLQHHITWAKGEIY